MISFSLSEIAPILEAEWIGQDSIIQAVSINSSKIPDGCLFVALKGKNFDGHCFISQAISMGARALLVSSFLTLDFPQLVVKNTRIALSQLGFWVRSRSFSKVIAITGSSGKTSVKEMTASILGCTGEVVASYGNFNNEIGVPLTLLRLTRDVDFAVIEIGANNFGEIFKISSFLCPDIALINNIFPAHLSGFESLIGVAEAKGEIFFNVSSSGVFVLNADNNALFLWEKLLLSRSMLSFSIHQKDGVDFFASNIICNRDYTYFNLHTPYGVSFVTLSMLGYHNVANALAASALAFSAGATLEDMVIGLGKVRPLPGRLFPIILGRGKLLLDDSYNANIGSMLVAIHMLQRLKGYRVLVVGDIDELGTYMGSKYHCEIGKLISKTNIHKVLSVGYLSFFVSRYSERGEHFYSKNILFIRLIQLFNEHEVITVLIKGSRSIFMDRLIMRLKEQIL